MTIPRLSVNVGKTRSSGAKYPWEPGYVEAIRAQMKEIEAAIVSICHQFGDATPELVRDALEPTFEKAKVYCPKDTHALVNSGYLEIVGTRTRPRVEIGFARGGNPHYAVLVHENMEFRHQAPTRAKFLEAALDEDLPDIAVRIGTNFRKFFNG